MAGLLGDTDTGLISGIASGLQGGMQAYNAERDRQFKVKQYQDQLDAQALARKQQQENMQMQGAEHNLTYNPNAQENEPKWTPSAQGLLINKAAAAKAQNEIDQNDPNSSRLRAARGFLSKQGVGGTEGMGMQELEKFATPIATAKQKAETQQSMFDQRTSEADSKQQKMQDFRAHQANIKAIKNDPIMRQEFTQYGNLTAALNNLANADVTSPQQFHEAQQSIRANLGIKNGSGIGERERTQLSSLGLDTKEFLQFLTGDMQSIPPNDPMLHHIKQLGQLEIGNIQGLQAKRLKSMGAGNASVYKRHPEYLEDLNDLQNATTEQFQGGVDAPKGLVPGAADRASKLKRLQELEGQ